MEISAAVEQLLIKAVGFSTAVVGRTGLERIIKASMKRTEIVDATAYLERLSTDPEEFEQFLEQLVVPETWFFRDQAPFLLLEKHLHEKLQCSKGKAVRILSAPCSTGEEPYSIAITLLGANIQPGQFHIDAADISRVGVETAARAVYGKNSFRQPLTTSQTFFFTGPPEARRVNERVLSTVHFRRANLVDPGFLADLRPYDVIFCRNVLIYLADEARSRVFANIDRLLAPDGMLFCGHAEMGILQKHGYTPTGHARSFACVRTSGKLPPSGNLLPVLPRHADRIVVRPVSPLAAEAVFQEDAPAAALPDPPPPVAPDVIPVRARKLADQGMFDEAASLCRRYLEEQRPHADVYCLLGVINEAKRHTRKALECYEKALYLDPDHYEALIHMSLLCRQRGDVNRAVRYRRRAEAAERRDNGATGH